MFVEKRFVKYKKKIIAGSIAGFVLFLGSALLAVVTMNVAPQKVGLLDVKYASLKKSACAKCHGDSLVDEHHSTKAALNGKCNSCHKVYKKDKKLKVLLTRNCMKCHKSSPHHNTVAAQTKKCTECHDSPGVSKYSTAVPSYKASKVTPKRNSCNNCHKNGTFENMNISSIKETHHGLGLKGCETCHTEQKGSQDIRICERCHSVQALHEVNDHVKQGNCTGCHVLSAMPVKK